MTTASGPEAVIAVTAFISASGRGKGLFYALGHGHLGLTYAATTARLMGETITGARPSIDLHPYRVNRF